MTDRTAGILLLCALLFGCGGDGQKTALDKHEQACRETGRVIVYDRQLWSDYQRGRDGYERKFGNDYHWTSRAARKKGLHREDITVFRDGRRVARLVDHGLSYRVYSMVHLR